MNGFSLSLRGRGGKYRVFYGYHTMRSKARECAFKVIYASLFRQDGEFNRSIYKTFGLDQEESAYADGLLDAVAAHRQELLQALGGLSIGFSEQRLFPVDKSILLMAMAELKYGDVPAAVCVDEAVGLAKAYSTEKSVGFVNGVLAAYVRQLDKG